MTRIARIGIFVLLTVVTWVDTVLAAPKPMLWYDKPAAVWTEAVPIGNGHMGAMVFGGTAEERIQFNEDTLWRGVPRDYVHPGAAEYLSTIRKLLFDGKQKEAERLAMEKFMSVPLRQEAYQPFGDLRLTLPGHDKAADYRRELDLDAGVATVQYCVGDVTYRREVFASWPDRVIVMRLSSSQPGKLSFVVTLDSPHPGAETRGTSDDVLVLRGQLREYENRRTKMRLPSVLKFEARLSVGAEGGKVVIKDGAARVSEANSANLVLAAATSFVNPKDVSGDPAARCQKVLAALTGKTYAQLHETHVADHRRLFRRVSLDLGTTDAAKQPTDRRINSFTSDSDPDLIATYFQFGRYLLLASSRPGSQPANLQGVWNEDLTPPWESKYTTNINTEMNYWPAEVCNLSECHEPLFDMLEEVAVSGAKTARVHYDCGGWVLHHNTDLWRGTAPINNSNHGIWPVGGAWLCRHLWDHYLFTGDKEFLRKRAYPLLRGAARFFAEYLIVDPRNDKGWLISGPSNSPEQGGLVMGPMMDHQIIREVFANTIAASRILDCDADFRAKLADMKQRIAPNQIGRYGQLQEWLEDKDNPKNHHRHLSHTYALYPGCEITPRETPELAAAVKKSLDFRGDGPVGWGRAWQVSLYARLGEAEVSHDRLCALIGKNSSPNLFDQCFAGRALPFQIDGNFGGCAGIAEMLLQSHAGQVELLPALPQAWPNGEVRGLRARGGLEVTIRWKDRRAVQVTLKALQDGRHRIRPPRGQTIVSVVQASTDERQKREPKHLNEGGDIELSVLKGGTYDLHFAP